MGRVAFSAAVSGFLESSFFAADAVLVGSVVFGRGGAAGGAAAADAAVVTAAAAGGAAGFAGPNFMGGSFGLLWMEGIVCSS